MCKDQCSSNCLNALDCDHITGACNGGCLAGWTGPRCDRSDNKITLLKLKLNVSNLSYTLSCTFNRPKINEYDFTAIEILISVF